MDYITTKQAAEKWGISDRRVRLTLAGRYLGLCKQSR